MELKAKSEIEDVDDRTKEIAVTNAEVKTKQREADHVYKLGI